MPLRRPLSATARACALVPTFALIIAGCPAPSNQVDEPVPTAIADPGDETPKSEADKRPQGDHKPQDEPIVVSPARNEGGEHEHTNRLAHETSPYLLLHAHNPVNWHPWDEEALAKAKEEGKPIFLSIGYSSCYWCHVMERESFMDEEIAKFLNDNFICIKVDREERPDIDNIYMTSLQMYFRLAGIRRSGGWPLSMFLTPDAKPFIGGTYWPARDGEREGTVGFLTVAQKVHELWTDDQKSLKHNADIISEVVQEELRGRKPVDIGGLDQTMIEAVWSELRDEYDPEWGGFGYDPRNPRQQKFPEPSNLLFLIDRIERQDVEDWEEAHGMLTGTLDKMAQGGIYDHLGGGFHRYSVDRFWHIPHFEKMLYDNGQLATVYAKAYKLTGEERYRRVVEGIAEFLRREMLHEGGAYYAALDAETDAEEGKYYRWEKEELDELLVEDDQLFAEIYNLSGEPNFVHEGHEFFVPMLSQSLAEHAKQRDMTLAELREKLQPTHDRLFAARQKRKRPLTDTKILTSWNGLMIRGHADAGRLLEDETYIAAAEKAAQFALGNLRTEDGRLLRTHTAGEAKLNAYLDDYAFLVDGLIALHRATGEEKWLTAAKELTDKQIELFWDDRDGGFFYTSSDHEELLARAKDPVDTVIPSGNSVSAGNLLYLSQQFDKQEYRKQAEQTMLSSAVYLRTAPGAVPRMAVHLAEWLSTEPPRPPTEKEPAEDGEREASAP